jgi:hypothetical protein
VSLYLFKHHSIKTYQEMEVQLHTLIATALDGGEWSASGLSHFISGERSSGAYCLGGWVGYEAGLDAVEKIEIASHPGTQNMILWFSSLHIGHSTE